MEQHKIIIIGYAGHSYVVNDIFLSTKKRVGFYCDSEEKKENPYNLQYLGKENEVIDKLKQNKFFIAIGDNNIREKVFLNVEKNNLLPINAIHNNTIISSSAIINPNGVMVSAGAIINAFANIGKGVIINTGAIIEHECSIGDFAHIAPSAVLCGNVTVGKNSFVGAGSVIKQGITIGDNVIIGAGSVVVKDVADGKKIMGNPAK